MRTISWPRCNRGKQEQIVNVPASPRLNRGRAVSRLAKPDGRNFYSFSIRAKKSARGKGGKYGKSIAHLNLYVNTIRQKIHLKNYSSCYEFQMSLY